MRRPRLTDLGVFVLATLTVFLLATWLGSRPAAWGAEIELEQEQVAPDTVIQKDAYPGPPPPEPRSQRPIREFFDKVKLNLQDADPFFRDTNLNLQLRTYYLGK